MATSVPTLLTDVTTVAFATKAASVYTVAVLSFVSNVSVAWLAVLPLIIWLPWLASLAVLPLIVWLP
jgi:hypothetical protein